MNPLARFLLRHLVSMLRVARFEGLAQLVAARCDHYEVIRYWLPRHYYQRVCKTCGTWLESGRDKTHRYPDDAQGVERGVRSTSC